VVIPVRVALGWPLLSPAVAEISINIQLEMDVPYRDAVIEYLGEEQVTQPALNAKP
jgi:hypothetical protein